jgi:hypothetical protein
MIIQSNTSGIDALRKRIHDTVDALPSTVFEVAQKSGNAVKTKLSDASPRGSSGGGPPPGDAAGPLSGSFFVDVAQQGYGARATLKTKQPQKLEYVVQGRGEVRPVVKKALFWKGLKHPVKRAGPSKANDIVTPVLQGANASVKAEMDKGIHELSVLLGGR